MKILIADDHALLSESLRMMLETYEEIEVVGTAYDGARALELCVELQPDVVLMDVIMPKMNGIVATQEIKKCCPKTKVIIMTSLEEKKWIQESITAGACGYLLKDTPPERLVRLIQCVEWGYIVSNRSVFDMAVKSSNSDTEKGTPVFKSEELQIIRLVSEGKTNSEIAAIMCIAEGTAKNKLTRLIDMAGVENRAQLVMYALKNDLI